MQGSEKSEREVACPDCAHRDWEICLGRAKKAPRHPQERPGAWSRLALCFAMLCVAVPIIGVTGYALSEIAGPLGALVGMSAATAALIMLILVIEGFGSSAKIGALRCVSCGFEQSAIVRPR